MPGFIGVENEFVAPMPLYHIDESLLVIIPVLGRPGIEVEIAIQVVQDPVAGSVGIRHEKTGGWLYAYQMHLELQDHPECGVIDGDEAGIPAPRISEKMNVHNVSNFRQNHSKRVAGMDNFFRAGSGGLPRLRPVEPHLP